MKISKQTKNFVLIMLSALLALTLALGGLFLSIFNARAEGESTVVEYQQVTWGTINGGEGAAGSSTQIIVFLRVGDKKTPTYASVIDTTNFEQGDINSKLELVYGGETKVGVMTGISISSHAANTCYLNVTFASDASFKSATKDSPAYVIFPAGSTFYNYKFVTDWAIQYDGSGWRNLDTAFFGSIGRNNIELDTDNNQLLFYVKATAPTLDTYYAGAVNKSEFSVGNFASSVKVSYGGEEKTAEQAGLSLSDSTYSYALIMQYAKSAEFIRGAATITIPANTRVYNWLFTEDVVLYGYNGWWTNTIEPISVDSVSIEQARNHYENGNNMQLYLYAYNSDVTGTIKANTSASKGNYITDMTLNGVANTEISLSNYAGDGTIILQYAKDASFVNATAANPVHLKVPAWSTLYNTVYEEGFELYFYDGKWYKEPSIDYYLANLLTMSVGAEVRMDVEGGRNGIRFTTNVDATAKAKLDEAVANGVYKGYSFGTIIVPFDYLTGIDNPTHETLEATYGYYDLASTYETGTCFKGALVNLKTSNYDRKWIGRGYVALTNTDDTVTYVYANFEGTLEFNARSIVEVAQEAYDDRVELELDEEEIAILIKYGISEE